MDEQDYVSWLRQESMLADASSIAGQFSGTGKVWQNPFANPDPRAAIEKASVWFTAYPDLDDHQARPFLPGDLGG